MRSPLVLCAVDFSPASRGALRYAAALAEHFYAALTVITVAAPVKPASGAAGPADAGREMRLSQTLEAFVRGAFPGRTPQVEKLTHLVVSGTPAEEILRVALDTRADVLVLGTHGAGRPRRVFGSTVKAVLHQTSVPVIVTPASDPGPESIEDWRGSIRSIIVPVDLSEHSAAQVQIGRGLAQALATPLLIVHVIPPLPPGGGSDRGTEGADTAQRAAAERQLAALVATLPAALKPSTALMVGDPATEIARLARDSAGIVVMGLHGSPEKKRHMGSVTYRTLRRAPGLVVAWPPASTAAQHPLAHATGLGSPYFSMR